MARLSLESSPIFRAVWHRPDAAAFESRPLDLSPELRSAVERSIRVVRRHVDEGTLLGPDEAIDAAVIRELAAAGYWGFPAAREHGGLGGSFAATAALVARMTEEDPYVAGLLSTQACLGPIGMLEAFGTPEQRQRLVPPLARGERLGAFAVTEPGTSSDWNALRCAARREGDSLLVTGEKFLITNAAPGRTVSVLCRMDGRFAMIAIELPFEETPHFQLVHYGIKAPAHVANAGMRFDELRVPADNLLPVPDGDGRTAAHFCLNRGRVAICGFASGMLRRIAGELVRWVQARKTFGAAIATRELVQHRLGRLAGRIVACDALLAWTSQLLDEGQHGQLECVTAKVFASEAMTEMLTGVLLKTLGGRALLDHSLLADFAFDMLAPPVYEGENEILSLGCFRSLARAHARTLTELDRALHEARSRPTLRNAGWAGKAVVDYAVRSAGRRLAPLLAGASAEGQAARVFERTAEEIDAALRQHREKMGDREALALELVQRLQLATVILVVSRFGERQHDPLVREAGRAMARELADRLTGSRPTETNRRRLVEVGTAVAEGRFPLVSPEGIARAHAPRVLASLEEAAPQP